MVPQGKPPTTLVCTFQPQSQVGQPAGGHPGDANISAMLLKFFRNLAKHRISLCTACALVHSKALDFQVLTLNLNLCTVLLFLLSQPFLALFLAPKRSSHLAQKWIP